MGPVDDGTSITHMAIPGTHDTGAYNPGDWAEWRRPMTFAQLLDIPGQLNAGVRALDLRCGSNYYGQSFSLYHGPFQLPDYVPDVIAAVDNFLTNNPSEFVILMLKIEPPGSSDWSTQLNTIINDGLGRKIYRRLNRETYWPDLREVRGKALILSRFPNPHQFHFDTRSWGNNVTDQEITVTSAIQGYPAQLSVHIQDLFNKPNLATKIQAIKVAVATAGRARATGQRDKLYLNFTSYVVNFRQPRDVGIEAVPYLRNQVARFYPLFGVVCVDAADANLASLIYNANL